MYLPYCFLSLSGSDLEGKKLLQTVNSVATLLVISKALHNNNGIEKLQSLKIYVKIALVALDFG